MHGHVGDWPFIQKNVAFIWPDQPDNHVKARGFTGPVRPEQPDDFATADAHCNPIDDAALIIGFLQEFRRQNGHGGIIASFLLFLLCPVARLHAPGRHGQTEPLPSSPSFCYRIECIHW